MARLLVHVEGETEETFVKEVLRSHLIGAGFQEVSARIIGNARLRRRRGGIRGWDTVKQDIVCHLREDRASVSTTMVDYYGLPQTGAGAWPGRAAASQRAMPQKGLTVQEALARDIGGAMGSHFDPCRFLPFVVMHEFEGLLFSDCPAFGRAVGNPGMAPAMQRMRDSFSNPEEINDSPTTAPSKRIRELMPRYEKPLYGTLAALETGLEKIRRECPHFSAWLSKLEALATA